MARLLRAPPSAAMNSRLISLCGILPAKHVDLLAQDQILRFQSRFESRRQGAENQLEHLDHQAASLPRLDLASSEIEFSVHTRSVFARSIMSEDSAGAQIATATPCEALRKCIDLIVMAPAPAPLQPTLPQKFTQAQVQIAPTVPTSLDIRKYRTKEGNRGRRTRRPPCRIT